MVAAEHDSVCSAAPTDEFAVSGELPQILHNAKNDERGL